MKHAILLLLFLGALSCSEKDAPVISPDIYQKSDFQVQDMGKDVSLTDISKDIVQGDNGPAQSVEMIHFSTSDHIFAPTELKSYAKDLQILVERTTNLKLEIVVELPSKGNFISLSTECETRKDSFIMSSPSAREIKICANTTQSLYYGVTDFAERHLGIRWLFPALNDLGTFYPKPHPLVLPREEKVDGPAYLSRQLSPGRTIIEGENPYLPWSSRMRFRSGETAFHHNLYNVYPPEKYRVSNQEWYPVHKVRGEDIRFPELKYVGKCKEDATQCVNENHRWQPVLRAPGLLEEGVKNAKEYFDTNPDTKWFSLGMNDSTVWGDAQMAGKPLNSLGFVNMSDYFSTWASEFVAEVSKTHADRKFGFLAYHNTVDAPTDPMHPTLVPYITY